MPTEPLVIGFGYQIGVGKDTAAQLASSILMSQDNRPAIVAHFADALKEGICKHVLGLSHDQLYTDKKHEVDPFWGMTPREMLQKCGTDAMRKGFREDVWVKALQRRVLEDPEATWLIADVRFQNEADMIKYELGGYLVQVTRLRPMLPMHICTHESEIAMSGYTSWDHTIVNNGSMDDLRQQVINVLEGARQARAFRSAQLG